MTVDHTAQSSVDTRGRAEKVTAFVTRVSTLGMEVLLFQHPSAGIQVPAGTVESGEPHAVAAAREAREETGLSDLPAGLFLEAVTETLSNGHCIMTEMATAYSRPDPASFDWASIRRGIVVDFVREEGQFSQVSYIERSSIVEPSYVTYQITGWVPTALLARQVTRYFYHFPYHGRTPETWLVDIDNHRFRLFWAPLAQLPPVVEPQRPWLDVLLKTPTVRL
ncbi:MAG: NUDIX domain-containing protein [Anaerolineae bacterium]|nr:NUDIX domain-containing protein [Anaerolineae bacterium]